MIIKRSIKHLKDNQMYYGEHFLFAFAHGVRCVFGGVCLLIHSVVPAFFRNMGSRIASRMVTDFKLDDRARIEFFRTLGNEDDKPEIV